MRVELDELLARARSGDQEALGELVASLRPLMFATANRLAPNPADADDLVGDVTLRLLQAIASGGGPTEYPAAYATRMIRNLAIDRSRAPASQEVVVDRSDIELESAAHEDDVSGVDRVVETALVREAFTRLPAVQRELLHEAVVLEQSPRDIAARRAARPNTVSVQVARARKALASSLRLVLLERAAGPECAPFLESIARNGRAVGGSGRQHLVQCRRCRGALARFEAIPDVLALVPPAVLVAGAVTSTGEDALVESTAAELGRNTIDPELGRLLQGVPQNAERALVAGALASVVVTLGAAVLVPMHGAGEAAQAAASTSLHNPLDFEASIIEGSGVTQIVLDMEPVLAASEDVVLHLELPQGMSLSAIDPAVPCTRDVDETVCLLPSDPGVVTLDVTSVDGASTFGDFTASLVVSDGALVSEAHVSGTIVVRP